jgi:EpsI family protein
MPDTRMILAPLFLLAQVVLLHWTAALERMPAPPALSSFAPRVGEWRLVGEDPLAAETAAQLQADRLLSRTYVQGSNGSQGESQAGSMAGLLVAWFQSQRAGRGEPHSPKVCLPASGWTPALTGQVMLDTAAGAITINRYIVVNGRQRDVVLYWYQGPRRVTAGEWAAKLWLMADAIRYRRTDTALVRVVVPTGLGDDQTATAAAVSFARNLYPLLRESLPR